jgi:hypothetical protein
VPKTLPLLLAAVVAATFVAQALAASTYRIYCSIHGAQDQSMKLVVR